MERLINIACTTIWFISGIQIVNGDFTGGVTGIAFSVALLHLCPVHEDKLLTGLVEKKYGKD